MYPKVKAIAVYLSAVLVGLPFVAQADSLQQAVEQTIASHPQVLSAQSQQEAANQDIKQRQGGYFPSVDASLGYGFENTDNPATRAAGVGNSSGDITLFRQDSNFLLTQMLFDGGNVYHQVAQAKANYQNSTFQVYSVQEALGYDAALVYLSLMQDRELLRIAKLNIAAHEDIYSKIGRRVQAGAGKKSDLDLAESRLAQAKAEYATALGQVKNDEATYAKIVGGVAPAVLILPPQPQNIPFNLTRAQQLAIELNPTLAASKAQVASNIAAVGIAKSAFFPTVTVNLDTSYNDSLAGVPGYNNSRSALLRMNYNVFRGGSDKAAVSAARYRVVSSEQDVQKLQRDTLESVAFAWNNMQVAMKRVPELRVYSAQSYNVWQAYIKQFQLGQRTLFDLLNSQSEYYSAQSSLVLAQYNERISRYQLLASIGELVSTVKNPLFNNQATEIQYPNSTIKKIKITLPEDTNSTKGNTPAGNSSSWTYPNGNTSPATLSAPNVGPTTTPAAVAAPAAQLDIPSINAPSSLGGSATPAKPASSIPAPKLVPAPNPTPASQTPANPTLYMQNDKTSLPAVYHLQLVAAQSKAELTDYSSQHHLPAQATFIAEHKHGDQLWYALMYGSYSNKASAEIALNQTRKQLHDIKPTIVERQATT